jgi:hypothetical protein
MKMRFRTFLRNTGKFLPVYTILHLKRLYSSYSSSAERVSLRRKQRNVMDSRQNFLYFLICRSSLLIWRKSVDFCCLHLNVAKLRLLAFCMYQSENHCLDLTGTSYWEYVVIFRLI